MVNVVNWLLCLSMLFETRMCGDVTIVKLKDDKKSFTLRCHPISWLYMYADWIRAGKTVLTTHKILSNSFEDESLEIGFKRDLSFNAHTITLLKQKNQSETRWRCCTGWLGKSCSTNSIIVQPENSEDTQTETSNTVKPATVPPQRQGNLELVAKPITVLEGQTLNLKCSIDTATKQMNWNIFWERNGELTLISLKNTTVVFFENLTDFDTFLRGKNVKMQEPKIFFPNLTAKTTDTEHIITFQTASSFLGTSTWRCLTDRLESDSINVSVSRPSPYTTMGLEHISSEGTIGIDSLHTSEDHGTVTKIAIDETTPEGRTVSQTSSNSDTPKAIVTAGLASITIVMIGSISGVVLIGLIVTIVIIVFRRKKNAEGRKVLYTTGREDVNVTHRNGNDEKVVVKNDIYETGGEGEFVGDENDEKVVAENVLYVSSDCDDEKVTQENDLYWS